MSGGSLFNLASNPLVSPLNSRQARLGGNACKFVVKHAGTNTSRNVLSHIDQDATYHKKDVDFPAATVLEEAAP